mmetsp:Transcript_164215/g.522231  ORF Transcript_164215/g.522231 Transcript_164215/m.522231 type:complete len:157 (+) Transcript_164215:84-554(+)
MPAKMQTADSAFQTVHAGENGYMVAVDEDPEHERDQAAQRSRGGFGCCSRGSSGAAEKTKAMTYVGVGGGEYIVEQRYKYIGPSGGEFSIAEPDQKKTGIGQTLLVLFGAVVLGGFTGLRLALRSGGGSADAIDACSGECVNSGAEHNKTTIAENN